MSYNIWKINGFNPCTDKVKDGDIVFYVKYRHSPNIKLSVGKFVDTKGSSKTNDYEPWHVVDMFDGKKRFPYMSEIIPINDFKAAEIRPVWVVTDDHGNQIKED